MKKYFVLAVLVVIALAMLAVQPAVQSVHAGHLKVTLCHIEDSRSVCGHLIDVENNALGAHIRHGDCQDSGDHGDPCCC